MTARKPHYFVTPDAVHVASIGKVGSTAIAQAILRRHYPDKIPVLVGYDNSNSPGWQQWCPRVDKDEAINPIIPLRNPVERFRSACAQLRIGADEAIRRLPSSLEHSHEFRPVQDYVVDGCNYALFPEQIDDLAQSLGLSGIPSVNDAASEHPNAKPVLTEKQRDAVLEWYALDVALYESLNPVAV